MITHLDKIIVASADPSLDADAWSRLLGRARDADNSDVRFALANGSLVLRRAGEGGHRGPVSQLVFGTDGDEGTCAAYGVSIAFGAHQARPASPIANDAAFENSACAIDHVVVRTADLDRSKRFYENLGIRLALDRSFPERGVRLVFFRVGGVTLELSGSLDNVGEPSEDALWGIAWRVPSADATRERLAAQAFRVSPVRDGHKRGTRVFHLDDAPCAVPTLVLEDPSRHDAPDMSVL